MKLPDTIEECHELIRQLLTIIERLQERVDVLEKQIPSNSRNSHRPPSSDGLKKPAFPPKKGQVGGKAGHKGKTLKMVSDPDHIQELKPAFCGHCAASFERQNPVWMEAGRRQVQDLPPIKLACTEYRRYSCTCTGCGAFNAGAWPEGVQAPVQYGPRVKSLITLLHQNGCLSVQKIQTLFGDLFGAPLNEATILSCQQAAFERLAGEQAYIQAQLSRSKVVHADESGVRVQGKLHWLHTQGNERFTNQFVHARRGYAAHEQPLSVLPALSHYLLHDCYAFYFRFRYVRHAVCGAHLLRELTALIEQDSRWAAAFHRFLLQLYEQTDQGRGKLPKHERGRTRTTYRQLLRQGYAEEPLPPPTPPGKRGRIKQSKGLNLLHRLEDYQEAVLAFAFHRCVPFTNNQAERDLRPAKTKLKVAGCFRTLQGAQCYARIHGFISTIRKHQLNPFNELVQVFSGLIPSYRAIVTT